ncbi:hypothetical protein AB0P00_13525 [Microbacterium sp. NPDC077057]|uniref:hypothetical protein n=1 Tax=Microbacterium sp. NPDC077057 TaxID=3154763 RepID=UPI003414D5B1
MTDGTTDQDEPGTPDPLEDTNEPNSPDPVEEQIDSEEQILEDAEELIKDPAPLLRKIRLDPNALSHIGDGFRALREGVSDFFVAGDRSAGRTKDSADRVIKLIESELDREGLSPKERLEFIQAGERMAGAVGDSEGSVRDANERTFGKIVGIAAGATVGVLVLGYLAKEGKLPPMPPTT